MVILSHVRVSQRTKSVPPVVKPPLTHAPKIGKPLARPVLTGHKPVVSRRELAKQNPSAPPNPTPVPPAPFSPNPQPTQVAVVATPAPVQYPAVPVNIPTAAPVVAQRATPEPSLAPPTTAPTANPSPAPVAPATAQPVKTTPQPTAAPTRVPATAAPKQFIQASPAPQKTSEGVPSPRPTSVPTTSPQRGVGPTAGPKALGSPGRAPLAPVKAKPAPPKPIALPPPTPTPTPRPRPAHPLSPKKKQAYSDLNARLRGMLPSGTVTPTTKRYAPGASAVGAIGHPTPPPEVLAVTKFTYFTPPHKHMFGNAQNESFMMWVTSTRRIGPVTFCTGWLVRFPSPRAAFGSIDMQTGKLSNADPGPRPESGFQSIIEENATIDCPAGQLQRYKPGTSPAPSPTP